jgi:hypothetical protein
MSKKVKIILYSLLIISAIFIPTTHEYLREEPRPALQLSIIAFFGLASMAVMLIIYIRNAVNEE